MMLILGGLVLLVLVFPFGLNQIRDFRRGYVAFPGPYVEIQKQEQPRLFWAIFAFNSVLAICGLIAAVKILSA
ncbi:hypothetical protein [Sphingomonas sp. 28-63-12]|uniref:hypothetical protein n=1 Tax=Sphingomonas sp. 28-63-12 TaxID=1970434 RepID=UPI0035A891F3